MMRLPRLLPVCTVACVTAYATITLAQDATERPAGDPPPSTQPAGEPAKPLPAPAAPAAAAPEAPEAPATPAAPETPPATPPAAADTATPATPAPADQPPAGPDKALVQNVEDFWHYTSVGRYDLAKAEAEKVLAAGKTNPVDVFKAFEAAVDDRNKRIIVDALKVDLYERVLSWQRIPDLKDTAVELAKIFNAAQQTRSQDFAFIDEQVRRLGVNERAYLLAMDQLKQTGELAIPTMLKYLGDPARRDLHVPIRSALRDMGYRALAPLVTATEMKDWNVLTWVISALGDDRLGPDMAMPFLVKLLQDKSTPDVIKTASQQALLRLGVGDPKSLNAAQLFYELGEKFYYDRAPVKADRTRPTYPMWFWVGSALDRREVPAPVYNENMAMRCCEYALSLDPKRSDAVALWIAAAFKREIELPQGAADPVWDANHPSAHYYAVAAGTQMLNATLTRALRDNDPGVALQAIKSLQEIVGTANLYNDGDDRPVLEAMRFPDRRVRFEAAFTFAASLPQRMFVGHEQVVPVLGEALAQTGKPGVLVLAGSQDELNQRSEMLNKLGTYLVKGGTTAQQVLVAGAAMPGVDVIIVDEKNAELLNQLLAQLRGNLQLGRAAVLIVATSKVASPYAASALQDRLLTVTDAKDEAGLAAAIEEARKRAGGLPLDEKLAAAYAIRAAELLNRLAINRNDILDLSAAQSALLGGLDDARGEIAKAAGNALACFNGKDVQTTLALKAMEEKTPDELKVSFLKNLATNAKFYGNRLEPAQVEAVSKFVETAPSLDARAAAAEAHGALRLSAEQIKGLILNQAKR